MKKAFIITVRSAAQDMSDSQLKADLQAKLNFGDDVRVMVKRAKDLDPKK